MALNPIYLRIIPLLVLATFQITFETRAQESIGFAYNLGEIAIHTPSIEFLIKEPVNGFTVSYTFPNKSGEYWRKYFNYPNYGISYNFKDYGNPEILGDSHSLMGFLQFSFLRHRKYFDTGMKVSTGIGYLTKKYNPTSNPTNTAISSSLNINADGRFYARLRFKPISFEYSYGLNHFSNGLVKAPNLGINIFNNNFSLIYELEEQALNNKLTSTEKLPNPGSEFWSYASMGIKEIENANHKYVFSGFSINYSKYITAVHKMGVGLEYLNDPSLTSVAFQKYHYLGESDLSHRYGISLHNEFIMGKTGLFTAYGFYLQKSEYYTSRDFYKIGFKYYIKNVIVVAMLRAVPLFRADVIELGFGYRIMYKKQIKNEH